MCVFLGFGVGSVVLVVFSRDCGLVWGVGLCGFFCCDADCTGCVGMCGCLRFLEFGVVAPVVFGCVWGWYNMVSGWFRVSFWWVWAVGRFLMGWQN